MIDGSKVSKVKSEKGQKWRLKKTLYAEDLAEVGNIDIVDDIDPAEVILICSCDVFSRLFNSLSITITIEWKLFLSHINFLKFHSSLILGFCEKFLPFQNQPKKFEYINSIIDLNLNRLSKMLPLEFPRVLLHFF